MEQLVIAKSYSGWPGILRLLPYNRVDVAWLNNKYYNSAKWFNGYALTLLISVKSNTKLWELQELEQHLRNPH